ncbi:MAG: PQQ-binding-like beta-propeller repeat protein, partial [Planctomycetes bacterium]|nr:PQQ-binding-like beta-propeller repeat protein [Planctomycetota bacterium]
AIRSAGREWNWDERPRRLVAVDVRTNTVLWTKESSVAPVTLAAAGGRVYFHDGDRVVALDGRTGGDLWNSKPIPCWKPMHVLFGPTLVVYKDVVLFAGGEKMDPIRGGKDTMTALSADSGKILWTAPHPPSGYASSEDLFVIDGLVWCGVTTSRRNSGVFTGRELQTGEVVREFPSDDWPHMPHHRCHRAKATPNYILTSRTGIEFVDLQAEHWTAHHWVRGSCNYGIMPSNGLVYAPPHSCACYLLAKLDGFNALAAARDETRGASDEADEATRLLRGPAYGQEAVHHSSFIIQHSQDWPTYRGNAARSGVTEAVVPAELGRVWETKIGGKLTSPVIAEGRAFVAATDDHAVHALDASSGQPLWSFTAGGRVDSPPTVWRGRVLFGSADGAVYCLNAESGALVWRFRAAPADRRLTSYEQLESVWPVHGSVLVVDGVVFCVAGRSMWLDGGLRFLRLDALTGEKLSETVLADTYPETSDNLQRDVKWPNLPVALPDVLSYDGRHVYMRSQPFDLEGRRIDVITPRDYREQRGPTAHLFSPTGFLDDSWWHRSYWLFGRSFISGAGGWYLAAYQAPAGRILSVDDSSIYGFGRVPLKVSGTPNAYHLFACDKEPDLVNPNPNQPPRRQGTSIYGPVVPTRLTYHWSESVPFLVRAIVATSETLFVAGPPEVADEMDVYGRYGEPEVEAQMAQHVAAYEGREGALLMAVSKADGEKLAAYKLESTPVFDGMAAAGGRLFLATIDGKVLCLGAGDGKALEAAPDVGPGPVSTGTPGFAETKTHPDFQHLSAIGIAPADLGYRMRTAPREVGLALKKAPAPLTGRVEFRFRVRPTPGAASPDKPGNAFLAFGAAPDDKRLVKCGFRISAKRLI